MVDFLAAEVPDFYFAAMAVKMVELVGEDVDAFSGFFVWLEFVVGVYELLGEGCFARLTFANDDEFGFVKRFVGFFLKIVVNDFSSTSRLRILFFSAEGFRWNR